MREKAFRKSYSLENSIRESIFRDDLFSYNCLKDFMLSDVKYIFRGMTYRDLRAMLKEYTGFKGLPLVDSPDRRQEA